MTERDTKINLDNINLTEGLKKTKLNNNNSKFKKYQIKKVVMNQKILKINRNKMQINDKIKVKIIKSIQILIYTIQIKVVFVLIFICFHIQESKANLNMFLSLVAFMNQKYAFL